MREVIIAIAVVIVLAVAGLGIFVATFNVMAATIASSRLEKQLGRKVQLGQMHLGLFPPKFRVQDLSIADDPSFAAQNLLYRRKNSAFREAAPFAAQVSEGIDP